MNQARNIDFVVGTQYGDEGKGMVAKLLADRAERRSSLSVPALSHQDHPYGWTARVGAQNAEHRFVHEACELCARILPSAVARRDNILALLGAGHCFHPEQLAKEAVHLSVPLDRIWIDSQAMWLRDEHATANLAIGNVRGTTGWGVGAAIAEKVRRKPETKLLRDYEPLQHRLCRVSSAIENLPGPGLVEGSQGALLSLDHGHYPYCTAKNVTVPAVCGELGINLKRVRHIVGVVRLVMMRVPGPSGPTLGREISYDAVEERTGLRLPHHKRLQGDTTRWTVSNRPEQAEEERLFDYSMEELFLSHTLNGYDALAITFVDYHRAGNYRKTRWDDLHTDTKAAILAIEREIAPVILVRTGQGEHDNIWRM